MFAIHKLVPDYGRALERVPGAVEASRVLTETLRGEQLPSRTVALISVAVAQRFGGDYARWAMQRLAAREWVSAEDVFFATMGSARDPVEATIVRAAARMASRGRRNDAGEVDMLGRFLGFERATAVIGHVALAMLACEALAAIAPSTGTAEPTRPGA